VRIFEVLGASTNSAIQNNVTWLRNLYEPLVEMGHDVILFSAEEGRRAMRTRNKALQAVFSQHLLDTFRKEHAKKSFELFFSYLMDGMIDVGVIDEIKKYGVLTCNFSCNNAHQFYLVEKLSPHFDYNLHSEKNVSEKFMSIGAMPLWWPMASNPKYFKPVNVPRTVKVSFVGANYATRGRYIVHLLENGIDVHAYGPGWQWGATSCFRSFAKRIKFLLMSAIKMSPLSQYKVSARLANHDFSRSLRMRFPLNFHPPVSDDELILLYSQSHLSLGFLEVYQLHDPSKLVTKHLHLREFEAPMSGALYCTGYLDELAEMFEPDKEVLVYRNEDELLDKVRFYLSHPKEAEGIRRAGHARALHEHTYHHRFETLFRKIL
jgi:spore maturation protein CgeB